MGSGQEGLQNMYNHNKINKLFLLTYSSFLLKKKKISIKKRQEHFEFNYDRYLAGNPADKLETPPHEEVRLGPDQPGIWTGRPPQLLGQQPLIPCHAACKLVGLLCRFVFCRSWTGSLIKKHTHTHYKLGQSSAYNFFTSKKNEYIKLYFHNSFGSFHLYFALFPYNLNCICFPQ